MTFNHLFHKMMDKTSTLKKIPKWIILPFSVFRRVAFNQLPKGTSQKKRKQKGTSEGPFWEMAPLLQSGTFLAPLFFLSVLLIRRKHRMTPLQETPWNSKRTLSGDSITSSKHVVSKSHLCLLNRIWKTILCKSIA